MSIGVSKLDEIILFRGSRLVESTNLISSEIDNFQDVRLGRRVFFFGPV